MKLQEKAKELSRKIFVGGSVEKFEMGGRVQLIALIRAGLYPCSKVVDVGCGALRGGYWLIHFLNKGCYFGIEPNRKMVDSGIQELIEGEMLDAKCPMFDHNTFFDTSVFGKKFDFFIARSVWAHAAKSHICAMLDSFVNDSTETGVFLASYLPSGLFKHRDYQGSLWVGKSHESDQGGYVYHKFSWIQEECRNRDLQVEELGTDIFQRQVWLKMSKI